MEAAVSQLHPLIQAFAAALLATTMAPSQDPSCLSEPPDSLCLGFSSLLHEPSPALRSAAGPADASCIHDEDDQVCATFGRFFAHGT